MILSPLLRGGEEKGGGIAWRFCGVVGFGSRQFLDRLNLLDHLDFGFDLSLGLSFGNTLCGIPCFFLEKRIDRYSSSDIIYLLYIVLYIHSAFYSIPAPQHGAQFGGFAWRAGWLLATTFLASFRFYNNCTSLHCGPWLACVWVLVCLCCRSGVDGGYITHGLYQIPDRERAYCLVWRSEGMYKAGLES